MKQSQDKRRAAATAPDAQELELLKAVAQAWHAQSGNPKPTNEFRARRNSLSAHTPSRFKLEAMQMASRASEANWDFAQSLWDSYEIVTLSKRLEACSVVLDDDLQQSNMVSSAGNKRARESRNSLRKLFSKSTSFKKFSADAEKLTKD